MAGLVPGHFCYLRAALGKLGHIRALSWPINAMTQSKWCGNTRMRAC
jgi:hypothetical protein